MLVSLQLETISKQYIVRSLHGDYPKSDVVTAAIWVAHTARGAAQVACVSTVKRSTTQDALLHIGRILATVDGRVGVRPVRSAYPLPYVPCHIQNAVETCPTGIHPNRRRCTGLRIAAVVCESSVGLTVTPWPLPAIGTARRLFPNGLSRQVHICPAAKSLGVIPINVYDGVVV